MKFKNEPKPIFEVGDCRVIRKFVLFPKTLENITVWLEFVYIRQIYTQTSETIFIEPIYYYNWVDVKFTNKAFFEDMKLINAFLQKNRIFKNQK